ncbi:Flagellar P-ring protein precursor [Poriferisphaera corsica]|uniref:Flagellar P-ring protein n=1 Tax=Poriferisphaera corsica TaxID=2528020 RepID=A0A517YR41_9BACT|nr:flagellar basal body P-ring protein FlgI [Poriferisphaera corsica]QDU32689.1 Flagellar P-ring protein precursor [Poriferisphaera corsica]
MKKIHQQFICFAVFSLFILATLQQVSAVQIMDIARPKGAETSSLTAYGLVVGLNGTGDGGKFDATNRALAQTIAHLTDETVTASEMSSSKNVALVAISAEIPASGVREGDRIEVKVSAVGSAKSLEGGRLFLSPMIGPYPNAPIFAMAEGAVQINANTPTSGVIYRGAQLTRDVTTRFLDEYGNITLVLDEQHAQLNIAVLLADQINAEHNPDDFSGDPRRTSQIAWAQDAKNVKVNVPLEYRQHVAQFLAKIMSTYIPKDFMRGQAVVYINMKEETIAVDGAVEISPVGISNSGLEISTITPAPVASPINPIVERNRFVAMNAKEDDSPQLNDLIDTFNQLKTPMKDRISIIKAMHKSGNIHAKLIIE